MPDVFGDPRFPRARCDACGALCLPVQTTQVLIQVLPDGASRAATLCNGNSAALSRNCLAAATTDKRVKVERITPSSTDDGLAF